MEAEPKKLKDAMNRQKLNWRSFVEQANVSSQWNNPGTPSYYVLDHLGVIRHKWVGNPGPKALDGALESLIETAEKNHPSKK